MQVREHLVEDWSGRHARQFEHQVFRPVAGGCEACNALGIHHDGVKFPAILVAGVQETGLVVKFPLVRHENHLAHAVPLECERTVVDVEETDAALPRDGEGDGEVELAFGAAVILREF